MEAKIGLTRVTTNTSKSFNCLMKRFTAWKERPIDTLCLSLYNLLKSFIMEIIRGRYGMGEYIIRQHLRAIYDFIKDSPNPTYLGNPESEEQIFDLLKNAKKMLLEAKVNQKLISI